MESLILETLNESKITLEAADIIKMIIVTALTIAAFVVLTVVHKKLKSNPEISGDLRKAHMYRVTLRIARILVVVAGAIALLRTIGVNLSGLSAIFGLVLIILALAVKDALADIFAGFVIMSDKYFSVGDAVEYEGRDGIVVSFTARTTKIELLDDRSVYSVANRNISKIRKLTHLVDVDLPLSYDLSVKEAYSILSGICMSINKIDGIESCELKGTQDFGESAVIYKIRFFCSPNDRPDIRRAVLKTVQEGLEARGVRIPYKQIVIHER